jgi:four helix bundle protein
MSYYQDLNIWKKSLDIIEIVYTITKDFPKSEQYALVDQMKRASVSIASNIAEWSGRGSIQDNLRFLHIAKGSLVELEAQIHISTRLNFLQVESAQLIIDELLLLQKMISSFMSSKKNLLSKSPSSQSG